MTVVEHVRNAQVGMDGCNRWCAQCTRLQDTRTMSAVAQWSAETSKSRILLTSLESWLGLLSPSPFGSAAGFCRMHYGESWTYQQNCCFWLSGSQSRECNAEPAATVSASTHFGPVRELSVGPCTLLSENTHCTSRSALVPGLQLWIFWLIFVGGPCRPRARVRAGVWCASAA